MPESPQSTSKNHTNDTIQTAIIQNYITTEYGTILGPFNSLPFCPWTEWERIEGEPNLDVFQKELYGVTRKHALNRALWETA